MAKPQISGPEKQSWTLKRESSRRYVFNYSVPKADQKKGHKTRIRNYCSLKAMHLNEPIPWE